GPHNGNCICIPTNCDRCEAERFFDIVYTADWQQNEGKLMLEMLIDAEMWDGGSCIEDNLEDPEYMNLNNLEN
ncbi:MAG: hypothetical protein RSC93_14635, partial [Erysipelotrichaceae bacterium]